MTGDREGALAGVRVLDLSRVLAGPVATQSLADLGADVLKVERPPGGDDTRSWGPPFVDADRSAYFMAANRSKASLLVDLATPAGRDLVLELARVADVVVENFKPGGAAKLGLDAERLCAANPRLVYASVRGFEADGPDAHRPGYDAVVQAAAGLMSITGEADGPPLKVGVAIADVVCGLNLTSAILAALYARERTGDGQAVEVSLEGAQAAALVNVAASVLNAGVEPERHGTAHPNLVPYQTFATADAPMVIAVGNDAQFAALCRALDRPEWADDARFATNADRVTHRDALVSAVQGVLSAAPRARWGACLDAAGVPWGPVRTVPEVFAAHPALAVASGDGLRTVRSPLHLSATPVGPPRAPPHVGEGGAARAAAWLGTTAEAIAARLP